MSSTKKIQIAVIASVALLMTFLLTLPIKGLVNPPKEKQTENKQTTVSLASELQRVKKQLSQTDLGQIEKLEEKLDEGNPTTVQAIAEKWSALGYSSISSFYLEAKASKTNTLGDWMQAADGFKNAIKTTADTTVAPQLVQKAIDCYTKVLAIDAKNIEARTGMAICYVEGTQNPMQGIQVLLEIVKEQPDNYQANLNLGLFSMKSGQFEKATKRFETVVNIQPDAESYFYLAESYKNAGDKANAIKAYETCAKLLPDASSRKSIEAYIKELKSN